MSLWVYLTLEGYKKHSGSGIFVRESGEIKEISREEWNEKFPDREPVIATAHDEGVYDRNITHNLNTMAEAAGIYDCIWRPDEHGLTHAKDLIEPLELGLEKLIYNPTPFRELNPSNGWGDYNGLVDFVEEYLQACKEYPEAIVRVSR